MTRPTPRAAKAKVLAYTSGAADEVVERGRETAPITKGLIDYQAERALELTLKLGPRGAVVLDDPVGTGKTVVALAAAAMLLESGKVERVLVVAPNGGVRRLWKTRAGFLGLDRSTKFEVHTRKLRRARRGIEERKRTLVVVDEAHRLQKPGTMGYDKLALHAADSRVLLLTATPFQLEARGLENMLCLPQAREGGHLPKRVKVGPIREYAGAVAKLLKAEHDSDPETTEDRAAAKVADLEPAAVAAMTPFFISTFDRSRVGIEDFFGRGVPDAPLIGLADWAHFYQVLRVLPELPHLRDVVTEAKSSDSYQRMILSSHRAVLNHKAFRDVRDWADSSDAPASAGALLDIVEKRLAAGDERAHPKVRATAEWVAARLKAGRHVLIFCVWEKSQSALRDAISKAAPGYRVETPVRVDQARSICDDDHGFGHPIVVPSRPIAMVVRDNLSESIDMDGGRPCVVHHDLVWNPVRWDQRMGRVIRASSGFSPVADADLYLPVLDVAADRRLYDTMRRRRELSGHVLQMAYLVGDPEEEEDPRP